MRKKNYKGRCEKVSLSKCQGVCKTYDPIQMAYANILRVLFPRSTSALVSVLNSPKHKPHQKKT